MGKASLDLFKGTEEAAEGTRAFIEKRPPDFSLYRKAVRDADSAAIPAA